MVFALVRVFCQCFSVTAAVGLLCYAGVLTMNYNNELDIYTDRNEASRTFRPIDGGCTSLMAASWVTRDCYSCSSQCGRPSCFCEVNRVYNVTVVAATPDLLSGSFAYTSETLTGARYPTGTCSADVLSIQNVSTVPCWYSVDPVRAAQTYACGSPQCLVLGDPFARGRWAVGSPPEDQRALFFGIAAAMLLLSAFLVGPCFCPSLYERCGLHCFVSDDDDSSSDDGPANK